MINEQTVKDIDGAIQAIRKRGWTQGQYEKRPGGPVCLSGALRVSIFGTVYPDSKHSFAEGWDRMYDAKDVISEVVDRNVENFNDAKGRTKRQVIKALKAAKREASKGI